MILSIIFLQAELPLITILNMGKHTKRKKSFYLAPNKRHCGDKKILNTIGYLGTCSGHEDICVRECYTLLNEFADKLYGKVTEGEYINFQFSKVIKIMILQK